MIELVRDLRVINVLAKFENDPWKIMDVRVLTGLVCPAARPPARPLGVRQYPGALKGCGVKIKKKMKKNKNKPNGWTSGQKWGQLLMSKNYIKVTFEAWPCELRNSLLIAMQCNICKYCIVVTIICVKYAWHKDGAVLNIDMIQQTCVSISIHECWV